MTTTNRVNNRELQQNAHAWVSFTGTKYTAVLRQMTSPLAQGLLGEPISARQLIAVLNEHELIGANGGDHRLGDNGYTDSSWHFNGKSDFIELALIVEMLRMFTPIADAATPGVGSYALKHTAEQFLSPRCPYVSNGRLSERQPLSDSESIGRTGAASTSWWGCPSPSTITSVGRSTHGRPSRVRITIDPPVTNTCAPL